MYAVIWYIQFGLNKLYGCPEMSSRTIGEYLREETFRVHLRFKEIRDERESLREEIKALFQG